MSTFAHNIRFALRVFQRTPGFAAVAVLTLAVGIGANTSIFSVANALLLRPLAYRDPDRLVLISAHRKSANIAKGPLSVPRFDQIEQRNSSFSGVAAFTSEVFNLSGRGDPEQILSARGQLEVFPGAGHFSRAGAKFSSGRRQGRR